MKRLLAVTCSSLAVVGLSLVAAPASAQPAPPMDRTFDIQLQEPAIGPRQLFSVETARVAPHLGWGVGLNLGYQNSPLSVYLVDESNHLKEQYPIIGHGVYGQVYGFFGFLKRFQVALSIPVLFQTQDAKYDALLDDLGTSAPGVGGATMGDLRVLFKSYIYGFKNQMFNLAASLQLTLPIVHWAGATDKFMGDRNGTLWPRFIFEFRWRNLSAAANVGFLARFQNSTFLSTEQSHAFTYGVGAMYKAATFGNWYFDVIAEMTGRNGLTDELDQNPLELDAGVRFGSKWGLGLYLGAGAGVIKAVGSPKFRVFAGVTFSPDWTDRDKDGVPDYKDRCPDQAEDKDGYQDGDGCPDNDNDGDGIPDDRDKCPNEAEDFDNFEDKDGCPDNDNDKDGVPDKQDNCPMNPGPAATKGCPADMLDEDSDGVPDNRDKCPKEAEDKDGFQDDDGCPDPDNDGDGVLDEADKCPLDPEDKDGFEDDDGCPDPDNDGDGVCDDNPVIQKNLARFKATCSGADKCPKDLETINGVTDEDGCPDQGEAGVKLDLTASQAYKGRFLTAKPLQFTDAYGAELSEDAKSVLTQLAHILRLRAAKVITQVAIMAFTDESQAKAEAEKVTKTQAAAVKTFLVGLGIDAARLVDIAGGGTNPICAKPAGRRTKDRDRCWRRNRRVEFFITQMGN